MPRRFNFNVRVYNRVISGVYFINQTIIVTGQNKIQICYHTEISETTMLLLAVTKYGHQQLKLVINKNLHLT